MNRTTSRCSRAILQGHRYNPYGWYSVRMMHDDTTGNLDIRRVYHIPKQREFGRYVKSWQSINKTLKESGISAPGNISFNNVKRLYEDLGCPIDEIPSVHIGGTNGKGSTSLKISKALHALGIRTGLFVSPHIVTCRERMQIDGNLIEEEELMNYLETIYASCIKHNIFATEFEIAFLMSTLFFREKNCGAIVLEVGMGGEYDATNVVKTSASVICSVGLDHVQALGNTIELITAKKVGIFKPNVPALIGPDVPFAIAQTKALMEHSPFYTYETAWEEFQDILLAHGLRKHYEDTDELNTSLALMMLAIMQKHYPMLLPCLLLSTPFIHNAVISRPPCRWEEHVIHYQPDDSRSFSLEVFLDMGHNPRAIEALVRRFQRLFSSDDTIHVVFGMSRDKDVRTCLRLMASVIPPDQIHFAQSNYYRALSTEQLQQIYFEETGRHLTLSLDASSTDIRQTIEHAAEACRKQAQQKQQLRGVLIICGTGYIMSDARAFVGIKEPRDDILLRKL